MTTYIFDTFLPYFYVLSMLCINFACLAYSGEQQTQELSRLKRDLEGYRELILPFNKVLEWEETHYPAILIGIITFIFA